MKEAEKFKKERDEYLAGWQRAKADFLNYKKEEGERVGRAVRHEKERFLLPLLKVVDGLERAQVLCSKDEEVRKGIGQIAELARSYLASQGVKAIETRGKPFDPEFHEALEVLEGGESGVVAEELEKGYTLEDRILRAAKVKVYR